MISGQREFLDLAKWSLTFHAQTPEHVRDWWKRNELEMMRLGIVTKNDQGKIIPSPLSDEIIEFCKNLTAKLERGK